MPLLERQAKDPGAGDALDLLGNVRHALLGLGRPSDGLLGAHVEARDLETGGKQDIARRTAKNVLHIAPQPGLVLRAVNANPAQHDEPGIRLPRVVEDLLEGLAVEERLLDLGAGLARHPLAYLEMRLIDLGEPGVDDLLVEL